MTRRVDKLNHALRVVGDGLTLLGSALAEFGDAALSGQTESRIPDDAFVDQASGLVPRDLYLQLARAGAFPSRKHGKRIVAQWRDVRAAMARAEIKPVEPNDNDVDVDVDAVRRVVGLVTKSRL